MTPTQVNSDFATPHWHTLYARGRSVGSYRLKSDTTYLEREIDFIPLAPNKLEKTALGSYLVERFSGQNLSIDEDGTVHVRLGPNRSLEPVSRHIAHAYKVHEN